MNETLTQYNAISARSAAEVGAEFIDAWPPFIAASRCLGERPPPPRPDLDLWSDGVHLSELGDTILLHAIERHLRKSNLISNLSSPLAAS